MIGRLAVPVSGVLVGWVVLGWMFAGPALESIAFHGAAQEEAPADEVTATVEKDLGLARTGRVAVRPQAALRLVKLGAPAAERLRVECGEDGSGLADLGQYLVEVLGDFDDPVLRVHLWKGLDDRDFPWRGPASRTLAATARAPERQAFLELLADHLAQVRVAAVGALETLEAREELERVRVLLADPNDRVRRAAAALLDRWGERWALYWLVEDLKRTDRYFRMPLGEQARFDSLRVLRERLGEDFGFRADLAPDEPANAAAIEAIRAAVSKRAGGEARDLPAIARAGQATDGDVLGLELRSCRQGEFYLRWNRDDSLYVGTGRAVALPLERGTVERLLGTVREPLNELGETRYWGAPGCDLEQFRIVGEDGEVDAFLVSKGPAAIPDLRPTPLDAVVRLLIDTLPDDAHEDPRARTLRSRVIEALRVLGGEF